MQACLRYSPPRTLQACATIAVVLTLLAGVAAAQSVENPNIVYILCDDLGYGDVHCLNPQRGKIATPNIDGLATQGMTFTDAHGGSSVCTPTRYGILTGRYAWRTRLQAGVLDAAVPPLIADGRLTVAELLRKAGYQTACMGKWHLGFTYDAPGGGRGKGKKPAEPVGTAVIGGPITRGFDYYFGFHHARSIGTLIENDRVIPPIQPVEMLPALAQRASKYIAQHATDGKPFFLYLALNSPHTPIVPNPEFRGKSPLGEYGDYVMETDWAVGQTLAAIDRAGIADKTLVIFTSDNGCSYPAAKGAKLEQLGHFASAMLRGYKSDIWDGGHRIPFIARWPGKVKPASHSDQLICLTDLMATCAEMLGQKLPDNAAEDSVSILPALLGTDHGPLREAVVHHSIHGMFAIRQGPWKLELCPGSGGWSKPGDAQAIKQGLPAIQLYDMTRDIAEQTNQQAAHPDVVAKLTRLLEKYVADGRSTPGAPQKNDVHVSLYKKAEPASGED